MLQMQLKILLLISARNTTLKVRSSEIQSHLLKPILLRELSFILQHLILNLLTRALLPFSISTLKQVNNILINHLFLAYLLSLNLAYISYAYSHFLNIRPPNACDQGIEQRH